MAGKYSNGSLASSGVAATDYPYDQNKLIYSLQCLTPQYEIMNFRNAEVYGGCHGINKQRC